MTRRAIAIIAVLSAATLVIRSATPALADQELIQASPAAVSVAVPAPGHSSTWTMQVHNVSTSEVSLTLDVSGADSRLFGGATPLEVSLTDDTGEVVLGATDIDEILDTGIELDGLDAADSLTLHGSVTLPREADNSYQGQSGTLTFRFVAQATIIGDITDPPGRLAFTGADVAWLLGGSLVLLTLGGLLLLTRKRTQR